MFIDKKRLTNVGMWVSIASSVALILQAFGVNFDLGQYNQIVNAVLSILTVAGILSNPTTVNTGYTDDKTTK